MAVPTLAADNPPPAPQPRAHRRKKLAPRPAISSHLDLNSQLLQAIVQDKPQVVHRLLRAGADPNAATPEGDTPLILACSVPKAEGQLTIVGALLRKGADVDACNGIGQTALMRAAKEGNAETVELLLAAQADVGREDCDCNTALCHAAKTGREEVVRPIVMAARAGGCSIDHRNIQGLTPLLIACQSGHLSVARTLVCDGGASPSIRDLDNFMTPADWMRRSGLYSESELKFLFPVSRKRSHYRQQRQMKGIKTLSDYLSSGGTDSTPNVFSISNSGGQNPTHLPRLSPSPSPRVASSPSQSMFDIPPAPRPPPSPSLRKPLLPHTHKSAPKPFVQHDFKSDLYRSPYLTKRQLYIQRNRQSEFFHEGALQPLPGNPLERVSMVMERRVEGGGGGGAGGEVGGRGGKVGGKGKHHSLPPLERQNSRTSW